MNINYACLTIKRFKKENKNNICICYSSHFVTVKRLFSRAKFITSTKTLCCPKVFVNTVVYCTERELNSPTAKAQNTANKESLPVKPLITDD